MRGGEKLKIDELLIHSRNCIEAEKVGIHAMWCPELSISEEAFTSLYRENDVELDVELYEGTNDCTVITFEIAEYTFSTRMKTKDYFDMIAQKKIAL